MKERGSTGRDEKRSRLWPVGTYRTVFSVVVGGVREGEAETGSWL